MLSSNHVLVIILLVAACLLIIAFSGNRNDGEDLMNEKLTDVSIKEHDQDNFFNDEDGASCIGSMHEPCVGVQYFRLRPACLRLTNLVQFFTSDTHLFETRLPLP